MRPVPLAVDLMIEQTGAPWPPGIGVSPTTSELHLWSLNQALVVRLGADGWTFEWESDSELGAWRVPAVLESLKVPTCPSGEACEHVEARGLLKSTLVPGPGERGNLGRLIFNRVDGAVWRYRLRGEEGAALINVMGVRVDDPLRDPVQLFAKSHELVAS